jgi:hypothetical protein
MARPAIQASFLSAYCTNASMKVAVEDLGFDHPKGYARHARTEWTNQ